VTELRPSANERFKARYREILGAALIRSVVLHAMVLLTVPMPALGALWTVEQRQDLVVIGCRFGPPVPWLDSLPPRPRLDHGAAPAGLMAETFIDWPQVLSDSLVLAPRGRGPWSPPDATPTISPADLLVPPPDLPIPASVQTAR